MNAEISQPTFSIFAELKDRSHPLFMSGIPFGRLLDEIVLPWDSGADTFFIDGAPVTPKDIKRLKIARDSPNLAHDLSILHRKMRHANGIDIKHLADSYHTQVEAIVRANAEDVTAQVLKAYSMAIKPSLVDYLPKREELISAAFQLFTAALKSLGSA